MYSRYNPGVAVVLTEHPHIVRAAHRRGEPIVAGTGVTVRAVVELMRLYADPLRVRDALPNLSLAQIYDALSYYHDHQEEVEAWIARNDERARWLMLGRGATQAGAEQLLERIRAARRSGWKRSAEVSAALEPPEQGEGSEPPPDSPNGPTPDGPARA
jgi:uncharacterized protein (DUF433 family)